MIKPRDQATAKVCSHRAAYAACQEKPPARAAAICGEPDILRTEDQKIEKKMRELAAPQAGWNPGKTTGSQNPTGNQRHTTNVGTENRAVIASSRMPSCLLENISDEVSNSDPAGKPL
ncbi:hypothetical protein CEUSTIGMA_g12159.t1 [Chlamydomonas eustigma]|uniref:Uncharacterized protein n=1 Tax=Chlamydomonas eustigma TaxID=1157962 RepID=A0A250XNT9_9CHLO|nr:hypothetical protein CEUSTIGMA_g12159.t1 [Chlamydomonas eustigma]|eukprot:GAX84737.1 hypothetical protein CEUSTIGMA_g12159.t1 [Chlamydomonas eustigma]